MNSLCDKCFGLGALSYIAPWTGNMWDQKATTKVCPDCWGSGDKHKPNKHWAKMTRKEQQERWGEIAKNLGLTK